MEIGTKAAQFPEKEYINGIFLAVYVLLKGLGHKMEFKYFDKNVYLGLEVS